MKIATGLLLSALCTFTTGAAMAAEMERDLIHERTMDGLAAAAAQGRFGGRPAKVDDDTLAMSAARVAAEFHVEAAGGKC